MDKEFINYLDQKFNKIDEGFNEVDKQIKEKFDKILSAQDGISKQLTDLQQENKMVLDLYKRHDESIEGHEQRISKLEISAKSAL